MPQSVLSSMQGTTEGCLPLKVVFHRLLSPTEGRLPPKFVFHPRSSSIEGRLPPKLVFHPRSSSTEGRLPPKVVFHRRLSPTEGCLLPKFVFHRRSSSTEGRLQPKVVFHRRLSSTVVLRQIRQIWTKQMKKTGEKVPKKPYFEAACCLRNVSKLSNSGPATDLLALIGVWAGYDHSERLMLKMLQFKGYNVEKGQWTTAILHNTMTDTPLATRPHTTSPLYYLGI